MLRQDFFKDRQSGLATLPKPLSQSDLGQKVKAVKKALQKEHSLPLPVITRAALIADNIVWQDKRKRLMSENFHYKKLLLEEMARRTKMKFNLLKYGFDEITVLLEGKRLRQQKACHGVYFETELRRLRGPEAEQYWQDYAHHKAQNTGSLQGIVASPGKKAIVKGRVRVLRSSHDILKPGEILVTAMTRPGYVFAMRHAAAVITDVGGLTSHAAVVAREIGVPCIVGTKIATRVLHMGDKVIIDTLRGIIKLHKEE